MAIARRGLGSLIAPVVGRISSPFGERHAPVEGASTDHKGIDYAVPVGTPVQAAAPGRVVYAQWQTTGGGNVVKVDHGNGWVTAYAHLSSFAVVNGQDVAAGQIVGMSGNTGTTSGPNLHFGLTINGVAVDPVDYLGGSLPSTPAPPLVSSNNPPGGAGGPFTQAPPLTQVAALVPLRGGTISGPSLAWLLWPLSDTSSSIPSPDDAIEILLSHYGSEFVEALNRRGWVLTDGKKS